jgi:hypothetical protein
VRNLPVYTIEKRVMRGALLKVLDIMIYEMCRVFWCESSRKVNGNNARCNGYHFVILLKKCSQELLIDSLQKERG